MKKKCIDFLKIAFYDVNMHILVDRGVQNDENVQPLGFPYFGTHFGSQKCPKRGAFGPKMGPKRGAIGPKMGPKMDLK